MQSDFQRKRKTAQADSLQLVDKALLELFGTALERHVQLVDALEPLEEAVVKDGEIRKRFRRFRCGRLSLRGSSFRVSVGTRKSRQGKPTLSAPATLSTA
jgi:hypothetical protein